MRCTIVFLLLAAVASVPALVLALPFDFSDRMGLQACTGGAEPLPYVQRSLEHTEQLAFDARGFDNSVELDARMWHGPGMRGRRTPPPPPSYARHDPVRGAKPDYTPTDPNPSPKNRKQEGKKVA
ncbi:hypothetical protein C8Q72DRAFT_952530 [Fomitopsis betulina]|nr:hypothetical protein C8Q72DRAFT_952530 [Fomitopsis betulina]